MIVNRVLLILILVLLIFPTLYSKEIINKYSCNELPIQEESNVIDVNIAIYTDEKETDDEFYSQYRRTRYFVYALKDYSWQVGKNIYKFNIDILSRMDLITGKLNRFNYDVMIYPPDMVYEKIIQGLSKYQFRNIHERIIIKNFIKGGGGFFGTCAGGVIANLDSIEIDGIYGRLYGSLDLDISKINVEIDKAAMPLFCELKGRNPEDIGPLSAYYWYSGWNQTDYSINFQTGVCLDVKIYKNNPIFQGYHGDSRRIRWIGGPPFLIPENTNNIYLLASFPNQEISDNESTLIHYWDYTGGFLGLLKGMFKINNLHYFSQFGPLLKLYCFSGDWNKLENKPVITNFSNKPFMTAEIYPNENKARIIRCTGHPEHNVWWGGYINETDDKKYNNQFDAFYKWENVIPDYETIEDEFSYNYWIIRRCVAWASKKIPDNHLPTTYGPSEVCKPEHYYNPSIINLMGSSEIVKDKSKLDLFYRYSKDNESWSNWTYYCSDFDVLDGWSWVFNSKNVYGTGFYEFYSIRTIDYENYYEKERKPPMRDINLYLI